MVTSPEDLRAIVAQTFLATLDPALVAEVLAGGRRVDMARGSSLTASSKKPGLSIVIDGLVRVFLRSDEPARQVTVRYARPGETLGLVHLLRAKPEVHAQAVTDVSLWVLSARRVRALAESSAPLAMAIAEDCATRVSDALEEIAFTTFGTVRQRVARHLLDLAAADDPGSQLVAAVTPRALAEATGSVREVIARVLKELHAAAITARSKEGVTILDAKKLDEEARGHVHPVP